MARMSEEDIARVCHEANRALQQAQGLPGIPVAPAWDDFPEDQREGVVAGVHAAVFGAGAKELHGRWVELKRREGWVYGAVKDAPAKQHPCLVPYAELPVDQRLKDELFHAIVEALS